MTSAPGLLTLSSGRAVQLVAMKQSLTYEGLLEGLPTKRMNDAQLERLVATATRDDGHPPLLITPTQTPIPYEGRYFLGDPASLPSIVCIGRFFHSAPARDTTKHCSSLTIIWLQDDYAFPISAEAEHAIINADWTSLACDQEY